MDELRKTYLVMGETEFIGSHLVRWPMERGAAKVAATFMSTTERTFGDLKDRVEVIPLDVDDS